MASCVHNSAADQTVGSLILSFSQGGGHAAPAACFKLTRTRQGGVRHGLDPSGADGPNLLFSPSRLLGPPPVTAVPLGVRLPPARPRRPNLLRHRWPPPASAVPLGVRPLLAGPATPNPKPHSAQPGPPNSCSTSQT